MSEKTESQKLIEEFAALGKKLGDALSKIKPSGTGLPDMEGAIPSEGAIAENVISKQCNCSVAEARDYLNNPKVDSSGFKLFISTTVSEIKSQIPAIFAAVDLIKSMPIKLGKSTANNVQVAASVAPVMPAGTGAGIAAALTKDSQTKNANQADSMRSTLSDLGKTLMNVLVLAGRLFIDPLIRVLKQAIDILDNIVSVYLGVMVSLKSFL